MESEQASAEERRGLLLRYGFYDALKSTATATRARGEAVARPPPVKLRGLAAWHFISCSNRAWRQKGSENGRSGGGGRGRGTLSTEPLTSSPHSTLLLAQSQPGFAFACSLPRSFGGDNVPFHDFTTFVTRHLAPTSFAPEDAEARRDASFCGIDPPGPVRRVVRVPRPCRVPLRRVPPSLHASLRVARSSKVHWVRLKFTLMAGW